MLHVTRITIQISNHTDEIALQTTLPSPFPPDVSPDSPAPKFEARRGTGVQYVLEHLAPLYPDAQIETLDIQTGERKVIREGAKER